MNVSLRGWFLGPCVGASCPLWEGSSWEQGGGGGLYHPVQTPHPFLSPLIADHPDGHLPEPFPVNSRGTRSLHPSPGEASHTWPQTASQFLNLNVTKLIAFGVGDSEGWLKGWMQDAGKRLWRWAPPRVGPAGSVPRPGGQASHTELFRAIRRSAPAFLPSPRQNPFILSGVGPKPNVFVLQSCHLGETSSGRTWPLRVPGQATGKTVSSKASTWLRREPQQPDRARLFPGVLCPRPAGRDALVWSVAGSVQSPGPVSLRL